MSRFAVTGVKVQAREVPGLGLIVATVNESRRADGTTLVRVLVGARYAAGNLPVESEHRDRVAAAFDAV